MTAAQPTISGSGGVSLTERLRAATPAILFGLRMWASVCVALWVAFTLELSEPSWAATTAALVCQPVLGASLRKSMFRLIGTVIGAIAIVVLAVFAYSAFHAGHYHRNRRRGLGIWVSCRGPWGTRIGRRF